jgi:hypothetical protein
MGWDARTTPLEGFESLICTEDKNCPGSLLEPLQIVILYHLVISAYHHLNTCLSSFLDLTFCCEYPYLFVKKSEKS